MLKVKTFKECTYYWATL